MNKYLLVVKYYGTKLRIKKIVLAAYKTLKDMLIVDFYREDGWGICLFYFCLGIAGAIISYILIENTTAKIIVPSVIFLIFCSIQIFCFVRNFIRNMRVNK